MANNFTALLCLLCCLTVTLADSNVSCYRIEPGTIAAIIFADLLLTLIIVVVTYRCASFQRKKLDNADKVYMNVRANLKNPN
ncbi:hematopoietic cell signal transducer [Fundulus heteroclitus]|uniref:hematopoietic cell signal transducer n=1 Tax=Fundulus heteroclitus TaxID=8078 RepID=UPI00165B20F6|nr:hematopoietic cell signal transducer [Fundulus heteroclitus]XP_035984090.1 hematopoietic cell signal transducer [Fundulus heteroclitus]